MQGFKNLAFIFPDDHTGVKLTFIIAPSEFIYVLEGTLILKIDNEVHELNKGDSVYYLSTTLHHLSAKKETATILAVVYNK